MRSADFAGVINSRVSDRWMTRLRDPALGRKVKEEPDLMTALSKVRPLRSPTHSQPYLFWLSAATYIGEKYTLHHSLLAN